MTTVLASFESFLGSVWFSGMLFVVGYIVGHVVPITKLTALFGKK
ncbi:MAG: hypothetical protein ACOVLB_00845 [Candidatus Nanopelagicus sp.]|jgi:hypothetical protein